MTQNATARQAESGNGTGQPLPPPEPFKQIYTCLTCGAEQSWPGNCWRGHLTVAK
jgi:hypothetical protein